MNILNRKTAHCDKDPFDTSDRIPFGAACGKGDKPRNLGNRFKRNFSKIKWSRRVKKPGKTVYRFG